MHRILLVEDEKEIGVASQKYLTSKGCVVTLAPTGTAAKAALTKQSFDCIVLDILLPDDNGLELCEKIRKTANIPILFLSCLDEEADVLKGLLSGGDDYMTKPFSMEELEVRILTLIRRNTAYRFRLDTENCSLATHTGNIVFSPQEFALLLLLLQENTVCEADFQKVYPSDSNTLAAYTLRLRKKLKPVEAWIRIETVYGEGYRLHKKVALD